VTNFRRAESLIFSLSGLTRYFPVISKNMTINHILPKTIFRLRFCGQYRSVYIRSLWHSWLTD